jgi:Mg-chelatase subunit ChlD
MRSLPHSIRALSLFCTLGLGTLLQAQVAATSHTKSADALACTRHAGVRGGGYRLRSSDGGRHQLEALRCYPDFLYAKRKGKWAVLDTAARFRTPFRYDQIEAFDRGLAAVRIGTRQGYIDPRGKPVLPIRFQKIRRLGSERLLARDSSGWHLYNRQGRVLNAEPYHKVSAFYDGFAVTRVGDRYGLITSDGRELCPPRYTELRKFFEGYAMVQRDGKWGHLDTLGREAIPPIYDEVFVFYQGLALARKGEKWGYINRFNEAVLPFAYDYVEHFEDGRALVSVDGKWGYIAQDGQEIIPIAWDRIHSFHDGMAKVEQKGLQGYLGWDGDTIIPPDYDEIYRFLDGIAVTRRDGQYGYIKSDGSIITAPSWEEAQPFHDGIAVVRQDGRYGAINREAELLVPTAYDAVQAHGGGSISVRQDGAWMYVDAFPGQGAVPLDPGVAARIRLGDQWGYIDQFGQAFGFASGPVEFVDTHADLGQLETDDPAAYTFHFRNAGDRPLTLSDVELPCGCAYVASSTAPLPPGEMGQLRVECDTWGVEPEWHRNIPVRFAEQENPVLLKLSARRQLPDSAKALMDAVPVNGRYVFLLDISASMDELPLAKMVFTRLAASLCRDDNISIVSFNSFSKVELRPTENHAEVVNTIRRLRPALKTDAARGLRLGFNILAEKRAALEKHLYMASDGDLDPAALQRVLTRYGSPDVLLTVFVFSYTGDKTDYERLHRQNNLEQVRYVYVDRENIAGVLEEEYTDIGCLAPDRMRQDSLRYWRVDFEPGMARALPGLEQPIQNDRSEIGSKTSRQASSASGEAQTDKPVHSDAVAALPPYLEDAPPGLARIRDRRRYGLVDPYDNLVLPPVYEQLDFAGEGLIRTRLGSEWRLFDRCRQVSERAYDSIGRFEAGRALARRDSVTVLLDVLGREYEHVPGLRENPIYEDPFALEGQPQVNLTLLLDLSASMDRPEKLPLLQETFKHFSGLLRYEDRVGIVSYTQAATVELPPIRAWQRGRLVETLEGLRSRGATRIQEGLALAYSQTLRHWSKSGNNRVILATDGRFEATPEMLELLDRYQRRGIVLTVYLFGEDGRGQHAEALRALSQRAGGRFVHVREDNMAEALLEEVQLLPQTP